MRTRFWAGVVVTALPTAACGFNTTEGGSGIDEELGSTEQKIQAGELPPPVDITCTSVMLMLPVDPTIAAGYTERALALDGEGKAQLWLGVSRCPHFAGGEVEYGPSSPVNVLLRVQGPFESIPVDGTAFTLPTSYFRVLTGWNDSKEVFKVMHKLGFDIRAANEISVGSPGGAGYVYEHGDVGFAWQQSAVTPPLAFPVGTRLVNYRDDDLTPSIERIACAGYGIVNGNAVVSVNPESFIAPFGAQLTGTRSDSTTLHCSLVFEAQ